MYTCIIFLTILLIVSPNQGIHTKKNSREKFLRSIKSSQVTCTSDSQCMDGFFCKNNDCVAKKPEGSLCLSGRNEECECGLCVLDEIQWIKICQNSDDCPNNGINDFNSCEFNSQCPKGYFCDLKDNGVCKSKVGNERLCYDDEMCACGKCVQQELITRLNKPPINYNICSC